ncbi:MAG: LacI family DNA-binding transcriptional regulator [Victivallaceae bacterium]
MAKSSNITELARVANVSVATVSRAMNNHPYVKKEIYDRIMNVAHEMNYTPARKNATKKRIGIIVSNFETHAMNAYSSNMLLHLSKHCGVNGFSMEIIPFKDLYLVEENFLKVAVVFNTVDIVELKKIKHTQFICINSLVDGLPCISSDHGQGVNMAVNYLFERGHRKIAMILPKSKKNNTSVIWRKESFFATLSSKGLPVNDDMIAYLDGKPVESVAKIIRSQEPDALICAGEDLYPVNYAISLLGINVPKDLSIISYENMFISEYMNPPQTTVAQDFEQLSSEAMKLASKIMSGKVIDQNLRIIIPNKFIERESVKSI